MRRIFQWSLTAGSLLLLQPSDLQSSIFTKGDDGDVHISNLHSIENDLYVGANIITIDGLIDGDLFAAAHTLYINGRISGSVNTASRKVRHAGQIEGSLRAIAEEVTVDGQIDRSVLFFGQDLILGKGAVIGRDVDAFGERVEVQGRIKGDFRFHGEIAYLTGQVDGNVEITAKTITIAPPAVINGNLTITTEDESKVKLAPGITILGDTEWLSPKTDEDEEDTGRPDAAASLAISKALAAFLFGIIAVSVFRRYAELSLARLNDQMALSFGAGLLMMVTVIICSVVLVLSLVAMVSGWVLIGGDVPLAGAVLLIGSTFIVPVSCFAGVSGGVIFYSGKIVCALLLGGLLVRGTRRKANPLGKWRMLLGLLLLTVLFSIPYLGLLLYFLISLTGAGAIVLAIKDCHRQSQAPNDGKGVEPVGQ